MLALTLPEALIYLRALRLSHAMPSDNKASGSLLDILGSDTKYQTISFTAPSNEWENIKNGK